MRSLDSAWGTYLVASAANWLVIALLAWAAVRWLDLAGWIAAVVVAAWIVKDLLLYPTARWYYVSQSAARRIIGERGATLTPLNPSGFVRVHGEIWRARVEDGDRAVAEGAAIRVRGIHGLELLVEPVADAREPSRARRNG